MNCRARMIQKAKEQIRRAERKRTRILRSNQYAIGILGIVPSIAYCTLPREDRMKINLATVKLTNIWKKIRERRQELA